MNKKKSVIITETGTIPAANAYTLDLRHTEVRDCIGCWTCWWKTPGRCTFKDLDEFYHHYITADRAIFFSQVTRGFVSGRLKTLFDRMIPLYLPYTEYSTGESMHVPRYDRYPDIEFYYQGSFDTPAARQIFVDYIQRVFYQFHSANTFVKPIEEYTAEGGGNS